MKRKVRVAQYGCGKMSKYLMQYVLDKGAELVAAFDMNPEIIGKDVSSVIGCDPVGVKISPADEADAILKATKPDVCVIATRSTMAELKEAFPSARRTASMPFPPVKSPFIHGILLLTLQRNWTLSQRNMAVRCAAAAIRIFSGAQ